MPHLSLPLLAQQLSIVDLLASMFCLPGELMLEDAAAAEHVRSYTEQSSSPPPDCALPSSIHLTINLTFASDVGDTNLNDFPLELLVTIPLTTSTTSTTDEPPPPTLSIRCPSWMDRATHAALAASLPTGPDCVLAAIDHLREVVPGYIREWVAAAATASRSKKKGKSDDEGEEGLIRVWFYFPSLSTREKRADMVHWAPGYKLTGFVLAGEALFRKPGVLCLEGSSSNIDAYMSAIKTQSWADIPSFQKKVSEKWRENNIERRVFAGMTEVTGMVAMHGARGNRGELGDVERMLEEKGLGGAFARVFL